MLSHPFFQSTMIVTVLSFAASIANYIFNLIVVKSFSPSLYGDYAAANSYIGLLSVPVAAMSAILVRRIGAEAHVNRSTVVSSVEAWALNEFFTHRGLVSIGIISFLFFAVVVGNVTISSALFVMLSIVVAIFISIYGGGLQASHRFFLYGLFLCIAATLKVVSGFFAVRLYPSLPLLYVCIFLAAVMSLGIGRKFVFRKHERREAKMIFLPVQRYLLRRTVLVPLISTIGIIGIATIDIILAKMLFSPHQAGLYGTYALISKIILFIAAPIASVSYVFFTDTSSRQSQYKILLLSLLFSIVVGAVFTVSTVFFAPLWIRFFASSEYLTLVPILWIGAVFGTIYSCMTVLGNFCIARNHSVGMFSALGALIQAVLILMFRPSLAGLMGINISVSFLLCALYAMVALRSATTNH